MRANHPLGPAFRMARSTPARSSSGIQLRRMMVGAKRPATACRPPRLLEEGGGGPPDHGFAVKQHQGHGVTQNGIGGEGEFMCEKRPKLGRHEASCLAQTFDDDERIGASPSWSIRGCTSARRSSGDGSARTVPGSTRKNASLTLGSTGILASVKAAASENRSLERDDRSWRFR